MMQKAALAAVGVLAVGLAAGYVAGVVKERSDGGWNRGGMMRAENRAEYGADRDGGRGTGMMDGRKDARFGHGQEAGQTRRAGVMGGRGAGDVDRGNCVSDECLYVDGLDYPAGELTDAAKSALRSALDDEYKALATYEAVMAKVGSVRPFVMIARAEEQHISSLKALFDKYGIEIPSNPYMGKVSVPGTLSASCQAGVDAEIANASLYKDKLLPAVKDYADITGVFTNLMNASQERHLPAFDRCN